ncbi:MAG: sigma-70 family RNA polymerase sigma factor [Acidimicrobiales bacterium]
MDDIAQLSATFQQGRPRLRGIAYRMLGSVSESDDALQNAWGRANSAGTEGVENLGAWLTTIVVRTCLNMLRSRSMRREEPLEHALPDPIVTAESGPSPEDQAMLADAVGLALQVVIDTLGPNERVAFVLHDLFEIPFEAIAPMLERTTEATRQLASRARRRVKQADLPPRDPDPTRQREAVDAFFAAGRAGDLGALVAVLAPDVVLRTDAAFGPVRTPGVVRGAENVARHARLAAGGGGQLHSVLVNGEAGVLVTLGERPHALIAFSVSDGKIHQILAIADPVRVGALTTRWPRL